MIRLRLVIVRASILVATRHSFILKTSCRISGISPSIILIALRVLLLVLPPTTRKDFHLQCWKHYCQTHHDAKVFNIE